MQRLLNADRLSTAAIARISAERDTLPAFADIPSLLSGDAETGHAIRLPAKTCSASQLSKEYRSQAGGIVPNWFEPDPSVYLSDVCVFRLRNAYYFPEFGTIATSSGEVMKSTFAEASYILGDSLALPEIPADVASIERAIVTFPWGANTNYGHFLLDCLPAIALTRQIPDLGEYQYVFPQKLKQWHKRHIALIGLERFTELDQQVYRIDDAIWTNCMDHFMHWPNQNMKLVREYGLHKHEKGQSSQRLIYLSRRGDSKRVFDGEELLEQRLEDLSFSIVRPESHSIDEQIAMFADADAIVGCTGAAFANVLYCKPSARIIEIQPSHLQGIWVRNICALNGCQWFPFFCASSAAAEPPVIAGRERPELGMSFHLDVDDVIDFIERCCPH